jgi:hypothetical protein
MRRDCKTTMMEEVEQARVSNIRNDIPVAEGGTPQKQHLDQEREQPSKIGAPHGGSAFLPTKNKNICT